MLRVSELFEYSFVKIFLGVYHIIVLLQQEVGVSELFKCSAEIYYLGLVIVLC